VYGRFELLDRDHPEVFAYSLAVRTSDGNTAPTMLVVLNFSSDTVDWPIPSSVGQTKDILINNYDEVPKLTEERLQLAGWQGVVYRLSR
jgi:hypothetical protein